MNAKKQLERATRRLELYYVAEEAVLSSAQSYTLGSRTLTRADLAEIRKMITALEKQVDELQAIVDGGNRRKCMRGLPRDI